MPRHVNRRPLRAAEHPGRLPELRAAREARRCTIRLMDGSDFEGRVKNFDRFAVIVEHAGADHMIFKHAIATHPVAAADQQLLLHARGLIGRASRPARPRHPHRPRQRRRRRAARRRRLRRRGQQHARQHRARGRRCGCPTLRSLGLGARRRRSAASPTPAPLGAFGRMAEASPGKDSVTGHWEMAGLVLDRPFPTFPERLSRRAHRASSSGASAARTLGNKVGVGHRDHRRARRRAHAHRRADRLHVGRQRVPDRRARGRRPDRRAVSHVRDRLRARRRRARRRPRHRAAVRRRARARSRARRTGATSRSTPFAPTLLDRLTAAGHAGRRDRQDRGPVRRPRHHRAPSTRRATTTAWTQSSARWTTTPRGLIFANLVDFDTQSTATATTSPATPPTSSASTRGWPSCCRGCGPTTCSIVTADHGNDPTTPSTDHSREYVPVLVAGARRARRRRPRHARDVRRSRPDAGRAVRRRRRCRTARASCELGRSSGRPVRHA